MEKTVAIFHKGAMARYNVADNKEGGYTARLLLYSGSAKDQPPQEVLLVHDGGKWRDDGAEEWLVHDLGNAIENEVHIAPAPENTSRDIRGDGDTHRP